MSGGTSRLQRKQGHSVAHGIRLESDTMMRKTCEAAMSWAACSAEVSIAYSNCWTASIVTRGNQNMGQ